MARTLLRLNQKGYRFDNNANNILVDAEAGQFNLVDLGRINEGRGRRRTTGSNHVEDMARALMDNPFARHYEGRNGRSSEVVELRRVIIDKVMEAAKAEDVMLRSPTDTQMARAFELSGREGQWGEVHAEILSSKSRAAPPLRAFWLNSARLSGVMWVVNLLPARLSLMCLCISIDDAPEAKILTFLRLSKIALKILDAFFM